MFLILFLIHMLIFSLVFGKILIYVFSSFLIILSVILLLISKNTLCSYRFFVWCMLHKYILSVCDLLFHFFNDAWWRVKYIFAIYVFSLPSSGLFCAICWKHFLFPMKCHGTFDKNQFDYVSGLSILFHWATSSEYQTILITLALL